MKVSATGLLTRVAELLPKKTTVDNQADMHRFLLREMAKHIEMVQKSEATLQEFAEHYCIVPQLVKDRKDVCSWCKRNPSQTTCGLCIECNGRNF